MMTQKQANMLFTDINKIISTWDEVSMFELKGVGNLSYSDLLTLKLYAQTYSECASIDMLMPLRGSLREVWDKYVSETE